MNEVCLTQMQAYLAMFEFLRQRYERGPTDELGGLLGGMSLLEDGSTADPAILLDFENAVDAVMKAQQSVGYQLAKFRIERGSA